jgi:hypothetical protein
MEEFKQILVQIFGSDNLCIFNLEYLYDAIGEDLNKISKIFDEYTFRDGDLSWIRCERHRANDLIYYFFLTDLCLLYEELFEFLNKMTKYKMLFIYSAKDIINHLTSLLMKKITLNDGQEGKFVSCLHFIECNDYELEIKIYSPKDKTGMSLDLANLDIQVANKWNSLSKLIYRLPIDDFSYLMVKKFDDFLLMKNDELFESFIKFFYKDDYVFLNLNYIYEKHQNVFDQIVDIFKKKMKELVDSKRILPTKQILFKGQGINSSKMMLSSYYSSVFPRRESAIDFNIKLCGINLTRENLLLWINLITAYNYKQSIRFRISVSGYYNSIHIMYQEKKFFVCNAFCEQVGSDDFIDLKEIMFTPPDLE